MYSAPSHNTTALAAGPSTQQANGVKLTNENTTQVQYEKILNLREEVFAGKHPRLKVQLQPNTETSKLPMKPPSAMPTSQMRNGSHNHAQKPHLQVIQTQFTESKESRSPVSSSNPFGYKPPNTKSVPTSGAPAPAAINPIFLTKSEVLVKAELQQKRQRIERALEEQLNQTKVVSRLKTFDQEAIPEFDVAEVLRKAQEIVKPFKPVESNAANRTASSSDSFDENTFYSSQMNESTTEEADERARSRSNKPCKYFIDGNCHFGDDCSFSHDMVVKQNVAVDASETMNIDSINADEQANSKRPDTTVQPQTNGHHDPSPQSHLDRIAELEEQLRKLKSQGGGGPPVGINSNASKRRNIQEEPAYSPPGAGDLAVSQHGGREEFSGRKDPVQRRGTTNIQNSGREYARHSQKSQSPSSNEVRVIRNHITSPIAPQPARVSPLAVARVPQISQGISMLHNEDRPSRGSGGESAGARQSPHVFLQPASSRKRRREPESYDKARHVLGRRDVVSPEVRIKAEPVSPPPYPASAEVLQPRRRQEVSRPIYIDSDSPRHGDREPIVYQSNSVDRLTQAYASNERRPLTPVARRIISRNVPHLDAHEGQDLRRVVSARQLRVPRSPLEQYAPPHPSSVRAASHVYIPQPAQVLSRQPRASVQPLSISRPDQDRSFSPLPRSNISPTNLEPISMAPPRRIVIDQYGQKYFEAPMASDRQASVIPLGRANEFVSQYEPHLARSSSIRDPQPVEVYEERQYRRRPPSPLSPRYVQYHTTPKPRQIYEGDSGHFYGEEAYIPRANEVRMIHHPESRSFDQLDDVGRPQEIIPRTQSVRPVSGQFEDSREHITRVQSVRPEQERVINLERRQEVTPQRIRQVSIRDDDPFARPGRGVVERSKYQYAPEAQERRYVEEFRHDDVVFEAPLASGRRPL